MAPPDQQRLTPDERANLVAYLDGELDEAASRAIATKLTRSPTARHEIETLQKTWEILDFLPLPSAPDHFTERTISEIRKLEIEPAAWQTSANAWLGLAARLALVLGVAVLGVAGGYWLTNSLVPDPTARVARELSLAEHFDEYLEVGSFDFLTKLADSPEFSSDFR